MTNKVGVIGAGQMGFGIAQVFASADSEVYIQDQKLEIVKQAKAKLLSKLLEKSKQDSTNNHKELIDNLEKNIIPVENFKNFDKCDLLIEAIVENYEIKFDLLKSIEKIAKPSALIATNTSSLSITSLQSKLKEPHKFIGIHFMNPANIMKLVEIIPGYLTSKETINAAKAIVEKAGKETVISKDFSAFIVNRILVPMINEAIYVLYESTATSKDIDKAMELGANHKIGPLKLADMIGLDICLAVMDNLHQQNRDSKYRACPLLIKMVEANKLGRKTKEGFYKY